MCHRPNHLVVPLLMLGLWSATVQQQTCGSESTPTTPPAKNEVLSHSALSPFSSPADVQTAVARMSAAQREELQRKQRRFAKLKQTEQARLRQLHADLAKEQDRERLHDLLVRYQQWLKTLTAAQRVELSSLNSSQRIQRIRELLVEQERRRFVELSDKSQLDSQDADAVMQWLNEYLRNHAEEFLAQIPEEHRRFFADPRRRGRAFAFLVSRGRMEIPPPTNAEFDDLLRRVSRQMAVSLGSIDQASRAELVQEWLRRRALSALPPRPQVSPQELAVFFREELTDDERTKIERLPVDEIQDELRRMYFRKRFPRGGGGGRRWNPNRGADRRRPPGMRMGGE